MPLIDLRTNLKSLKYGHDRPGGGDSAQPYIQTDVDNPVSTLSYAIRNPALKRFLEQASKASDKLKIGAFDVDKVISSAGTFIDKSVKLDDGFVRGGTIGALDASVTDTIRIGKFLTDLPKGTLFIAKQVGLQLSNPRLEVRKGVKAVLNDIFSFNPARVGNALGTLTGGLLEPTRIYNLGINTLAQVPVNAFGGHIVRHGLLPIQSDKTNYESIVEFNNKDNNRLVELTSKFDLGDRVPNAPLRGNKLIIDNYLGGPDSAYGIGWTTIHRKINTEDKSKINFAVSQSNIFAGKSRDKTGNVGAPIDINYYNTLGVSKFYFSGSREIKKYTHIDDKNPNQKPQELDLATYAVLYNNPPKPIAIGNVSANVTIYTPSLPVAKSSYANYKKIIDSKQLLPDRYISNLPVSTAYGSTIIQLPVNGFGIYGDNARGLADPIVTNYPIYRGTEGDIIAIKIPWNKVFRENRIGDFGRQNSYLKTKISGSTKVIIPTTKPGRADSINLTPIFQETKYFGKDSIKFNTNGPGGTFNIRDLVKFRIQAVKNNNPDLSNFMVFRALLTNLTDNVDAEWSDIKYVGRGNPFYIYNGFSRKIQIGFKVAALSAEEMQPMYSKLNYLMSTLMPEYVNNAMQGNLHRMTIGNYFDGQLGIINSLSYTVPNDSPWEIALDEPEGGVAQLILPHIIEVSLGFTPIGAETKTNNRIEAKSLDTSFIAQNNTGKDINTIQYYNDSFNY
jgi:hypothetical protein